MLTTDHLQSLQQIFLYWTSMWLWYTKCWLIFVFQLFWIQFLGFVSSSIKNSLCSSFVYSRCLLPVSTINQIKINCFWFQPSQNVADMDQVLVFRILTFTCLFSIQWMYVHVLWPSTFYKFCLYQRKILLENNNHWNISITICHMNLFTLDVG